MNSKEWILLTAAKVGMLTVVVLLILALNYSTWDSSKDLRATLMIAAYYLVQTITSAKIQGRLDSQRDDGTKDQ